MEEKYDFIKGDKYERNCMGIGKYALYVIYNKMKYKYYKNKLKN